MVHLPMIPIIIYSFISCILCSIDSALFDYLESMHQANEEAELFAFRTLMDLRKGKFITSKLDRSLVACAKAGMCDKVMLNERKCKILTKGNYCRRRDINISTFSSEDKMYSCNNFECRSGSHQLFSRES